MYTRAAGLYMSLSCLLGLSLPTLASHQHPQALANVHDPSLRQEIALIGPYAETDDPYLTDSLDHLPLRSASGLHVEFADAGVRARIEAYPFQQARWVKVRKDGLALLDGRALCSWGSDSEHLRLGRVEVVVDGLVCTVPPQDLLDVFDPVGLRSASPEHWFTVARSRDGYRIYVQVLAGSGDQAACITWVFEDGRYLFRVVDAYDEG